MIDLPNHALYLKTPLNTTEKNMHVYKWYFVREGLGIPSGLDDLHLELDLILGVSSSLFPLPLFTKQGILETRCGNFLFWFMYSFYIPVTDSPHPPLPVPLPHCPLPTSSPLLFCLKMGKLFTPNWDILSDIPKTESFDGVGKEWIGNLVKWLSTNHVIFGSFLFALPWKCR